MDNECLALLIFQLNLFTDAPPDQDEGGTESSDDDVIFENLADMDDDSSSEEESLPSGLSDLSDNDDIGDIITLKDDSDSEDDGSIGDDEDGDDENNGVSDEEVEDEPNTVKDSKKAERKGKLAAAAGKKDKSEREENAKVSYSVVCIRTSQHCVVTDLSLPQGRASKTL